MRIPLIRAGAAILGALMVLLVALPLTASAETASDVPNSEEAWFLAKKEFLAEPTGEDPTCDLPVGCNVSGSAQRPSPHPEGVLVVASNGGDPDAQMFINADVASLPLGTKVTGGTVTLPVAQDPDARNVRPQDAKMVACMVTGFIPDGTDAGSYGDRPDVDQKMCVPVKLQERKEETDPLVFTVDLERFGKEWAEGAFMSGITLMVDPAIEPPAPEETWRVAFNNRRRAQQETEAQKEQPEESRIAYPAITWDLQYTVESFGGFAPPAPPPPADTGTSGGFDDGTSDDFSTDTGDSGAVTSGGFDSGTAAPADTGTISAPESSAAPPLDAGAEEAPLAAAPQPAAAPATVPAAAVGPSMALWLVPLIALAGAGAMAWSLMQPVELAGAREGAVSKLMRTRRLNAANPS